jgi:hypothetical protein
MSRAWGSVFCGANLQITHQAARVDAFGVCVEGSIRHPAVDFRQDAVQQRIIHLRPSLGRSPWLEGLHFIAVWIHLCRVAEADADQLEPSCWSAERCKVGFGAIKPNVLSALFLGDVEGLRVLFAHPPQRIGKPDRVDQRARTTTSMGVAWIGSALGGVMRHINRYVVFGGKVLALASMAASRLALRWPSAIWPLAFMIFNLPALPPGAARNSQPFSSDNGML